MALKPPRQPGIVTRAQLSRALLETRRKYEEGSHQIPSGPVGTGDLTGTGFIHVSNGVADTTPKLVDTGDITDHAVTFPKMRQIDGNKILGNASGVLANVAEIDCTAAGRALLDDASAAAQRITLGLGPQPHIPDAVLGTEVATINAILDLLEALVLMDP